MSLSSCLIKSEAVLALPTSMGKILWIDFGLDLPLVLVLPYTRA